VAKLLSVLERGTAFSVEDVRRHRERGIEAAIMLDVCMNEKVRKNERATTMVQVRGAQRLEYPH